MELKAGVIGCGLMGDIHSECLKNIDGMKMKAFCDTNIKNAENLCKKYDGEYFTDDYLRLLKDDSLDAIYICTYHDTHTFLALKCCEYKKNVFIEKPLALNLEEIYKIGNEVDKTNIYFMVGLKARFYPLVKKAKELVKKPILTIGQLLDEKWDDTFWANHPTMGGGNVMSQGCHIMDLVYYMNESEPKTIFATGGNFNHPKLDIIDNIITNIEFDSGAIASVTIGDSGINPLVSKFSLQIFDGINSIHLFNRMKSGLFVENKKETKYEDPEEFAFIEENKHFVYCLKNKIKPNVTWIDGLRTTAMILKSFESIKSKKPIDFIL